jgi:hypothetical protein
MKTPIEQLFESLSNQGVDLSLIPKERYLKIERDYASLRVEEETKKAKSFEELCVSMQQTNEAVIKRMNFLSKTNRQLVEALNEIYEFSLGESDLTFIRDTAHKAILSQFNKEEKA